MYAMFQGNSQQPLLFRADDEFKDLTTVINAMQEKLQQTKKTALKRGKKRD